MKPLGQLDRDRLVKLLGMLGSAHDREILNAARAAEKLRREAGKSWPEILSANGTGNRNQSGREDAYWRVIEENVKLLDENVKLRRDINKLHLETDRLGELLAQRPPIPARRAREWREHVERALCWEHRLTQWEREFLEGLCSRRKQSLSPKQRDILADIATKVDFFARQERSQ
jgi:hypothetical protein